MENKTKKSFEAPRMILIRLDAGDIVRTSGLTSQNNETEILKPRHS